MRVSFRALLPVVVAALAACASGESSTSNTPAVEAVAAQSPWAAVTEAVAVVNPTKGNSAHGVVHFSQTADGVTVVADIEGLKPNARHAFHIHEFGDATSPDGTSAGGHYNPAGEPHGSPDADKHHAGDLGNLVSDAKGRAHYEKLVHGATVAGDHAPIIGRCVIIHASEDDMATQPTGNAGARIACGVIGVAKVAAK